MVLTMYICKSAHKVANMPIFNSHRSIWVRITNRS